MNTGVTMKTFPLDIELMTGNKKERKNNMIKCGLCGKEFGDDQFEEYAVHVQSCAAEHSMKKKTEDMKKIQAELEEVKRAKVCYEGLRDAFKEKYPDIYKINFPEESNNNFDSKNNIKSDTKSDENKSNNSNKSNKNYKNGYDALKTVYNMYNPFEVTYKNIDSKSQYDNNEHDKHDKLDKTQTHKATDEKIDDLTKSLLDLFIHNF